MIESCLDCVRKHIGTAYVYFIESLMGYPLHRFLAAGHLSAAMEECLKDYPELSAEVRKTYCLILKSEADAKQADFMRLLALATYLAGEGDILTRAAEANNGNSKFTDLHRLVPEMFEKKGVK